MGLGAPAAQESRSNCTAQSRAEGIMLHNIKTRASLRGGREDGCYARRDVRKPSWPKLCVLKKTWPEFAQLRRQFTAELPTSLLADRQQRADFIITKTVYVKFLDIISGVVEQQTTYVVIPHREGEPTRAAILIGTIKTIIVVVDVGQTIEIVETVIVQMPVHDKSTGMVVNNVKHDGDAVHMAKIDQRF